MKRYIIFKKSGKHRLIDRSYIIECRLEDLNCSHKIKINKNNQVYHYWWKSEVLYDIYRLFPHCEKGKEYLGKLIYESDDIEEIALKFSELKREE